MNKIVISGYYGFANAGDEAMLTSIVRALRGVQPEIDLTVISGNPAETSAKHKVKSIYRFNFFKIYNALKNADMLLSGGGSLLQDVTSLRSLFYYLFIIFNQPAQPFLLSVHHFNGQNGRQKGYAVFARHWPDT